MKIIVALLILSFIVIVHELGHFLLAKKNGITVTEFSVGMGPRLASFVHNGTRYSLKLFPIGGSCMMLGEDDLVEDEGAFNKKGVWARFSVVFAGAFFNFILAFILSLIFLGDAGVDKPIINYIGKNSAAQGQLEKGDLITSINGSKMHFSGDIRFYYYFNQVTKKPVKLTLIRDGKKDTITITPKPIYKLGCDYSMKDTNAKLTYVLSGYPLATAGLKVGDVIVSINGTIFSKEQTMEAYLKSNPLTKDTITLTYLKDGKGSLKTVQITPKMVYDMGWNYNPYREKVSAPEVVKYSVYEVNSNIVNTVKSVLYLCTGKVSAKEISGPVGIVNYVGNIVSESKTSGIRVMALNLIYFSILISANLGVMNLLPLPALDGGRLVFILIEAIRRKPVPKEKEAMVHMIGFILLMLLMVFVMYNDIMNIINR